MTESTDKKAKAALYLCRLIKCAFCDEVPGDLPEGVTLEKLYSLARKNGVESVSAYGMMKGSFEGSADTVEKWRRSIDKALMKQAYFDTERNRIFAEMKKAGLSYLSLKGIRLVNYYPLPGMRSMGDNDILYGFVEPDPDGGYRISPEEGAVERAQKIMTDIMTAGGYEIESLSGNHDAYHKKPFYNFEMHRDIVPDYDLTYPYYVNPWKRAVLCEGSDAEYTFSLEDDYIYNLAHMHTHFIAAGCGLRQLVDMYVTDKMYGDSFDREYLERELRTAGLFEFHEKILGVMKALFYGEPDEEQLKVILYMAGAGTYGTRETMFENAMNRINEEDAKGFRAKLRYIKRRIFLPRDVCKRTYPAFYGKPWLMPVLIFYRLGKSIFSGTGRLGREIKMLIRHKDK